MPAPEPTVAQTAAPARWLSIVGIGEDGLAGLGATARALVMQAELVFGGTRHIALAEGLIRGEARMWPTPFADGVEAVVAARGRRVCVLASGDPFLHGVGATLARRVPAGEMQVVPGLSAFSLAAARLCWSLPEILTLSLLTQPVDSLRPALQPGARLLVLTADETAPAAIARYLTQIGFGDSLLKVLEALGGPRERVRDAVAAAFDLDGIDRLNLVAIEVVASPASRPLPLATGLADDFFEHDGQITKREVRTVTLSSLSPHRGERLWDIGGGSGSIAIEWLLADASLAAIAIEARPGRAARIRRNALSLGVPRLQVVEGAAPEALRGLPVPDAIFIGGGATDAGVLESAVAALRSGGRLVVNAVTLETEALLIASHAAVGGTMIRLSVAQASPVGGMTGWRPAMPVTQWTWVKP